MDLWLSIYRRVQYGQADRGMVDLVNQRAVAKKIYDRRNLKLHSIILKLNISCTK